MTLQSNTFAEYLPALLTAEPQSAEDFDAVLSAYGLHTRRFEDLDARHRELLDALQAHDKELDPRHLLAVATWAVGQIEGRLDDSALEELEHELEPELIRRCGLLKGSLPPEHPLVDILTRYQALLAELGQAADAADRVLARTGNRHSDRIAAQVLGLRPTLTRHRRVMAALLGFVGDPGVVAIFHKLRDLYQRLRQNTRDSLAEDLYDEMLSLIDRHLLVVDVSPQIQAKKLAQTARETGNPALAREATRLDPSCAEAWLALVATNREDPPASRVAEATAALGAVRGVAAKDLYSCLGDCQGKLGNYAASFQAYLNCLQCIWDKQREPIIAYAAAIQASRLNSPLTEDLVLCAVMLDGSRATLATQSPTLTRTFGDRLPSIVSHANTLPKTEEMLARALGFPSMTLRLHAFNAVKEDAGPELVRALVGLLSRPMGEVKEWRDIYREALPYKLLIAQRRDLVLEALRTVEVLPEHIESWGACARKLGTPVLRERADALLRVEPAKALVEYLAAVGSGEHQALAQGALRWRNLDALERATDADPALLDPAGAPIDALAQIAAAEHPVATRLLVGMGAVREPLLWRAGPETAAWLLAQGADPNVEIDGDTPLLHAARADLPALCRALLAAGARPDPRALESALATDHPAVALLLIQAGLPADPDDVAARCPDLALRLSGEEPSPEDLPAVQRWVRSGPPSEALGAALMREADRQDPALTALREWARQDTPQLVALALALARQEPAGSDERPGWRAFHETVTRRRDRSSDIEPYVAEIAALLPLLWERRQRLGLQSWLMSLVEAQPSHPDALEYGLRAAEQWDALLPEMIPLPEHAPRLLAILERLVESVVESDYVGSYNVRMIRIKGALEMLDGLGVSYSLPERLLSKIRSL